MEKIWDYWYLEKKKKKVNNKTSVLPSDITNVIMQKCRLNYKALDDSVLLFLASLLVLTKMCLKFTLYMTLLKIDFFTCWSFIIFFILNFTFHKLLRKLNLLIQIFILYNCTNYVNPLFVYIVNSSCLCSVYSEGLWIELSYDVIATAY